MAARRDRVVLAVLVFVVLAFGARLVGLGSRPFSWSEGRIGYWTLRYLDTGAYYYRPVAGGPLLYILGRHVLALTGVTDTTARLVPALIGGALPATALLFRERLEPDETVLLAAILAVSPLLIYYSRVLRGDLPAAALGFLVLAGVVRFRDTGASRWLYVAAGALAAAMAASAFTVAYVATWLVAGGLTIDRYRVRGDPAAIRDRLTSARDWLAAEATPLARALFVFLAVIVFFFAPRAGGAGPGLFNPSTFPTVLEQATFGAADSFLGVHVGYRTALSRRYGTPLLPFVTDVLNTLVRTTLPTVLLALGGFLHERYRDGTRPLVAFAGFAAGAAVLFIPIAAPITGPWNAVHIVPLLAIPAAIGAARLVQAGRTATRAGDTARSLAGIVLVAALLLQAGGAAATAYESPQRGSPYAGYAQPADDLDPMFAAAERALRDNQGVDVLYVGTDLATRQEYDRPPVADSDRSSWARRLPLQWYFERLNAAVDSVPAANVVPQDPPPVVVTTPAQQAAVSTQLDGYQAFELRLGLFDRAVVVFVEER